MFSSTVVFSSQSAGEYAMLFLYVCVTLAVLVAWASIVQKAGFSRWWIALPATASGLAVVLMALLFFDTQTVTLGTVSFQVPATTARFQALVDVDAALYVGCVVLFFVFAAVRWPVEREADRAHAQWREERGRRLALQVEAASKPLAAPAWTGLATTSATSAGSSSAIDVDAGTSAVAVATRPDAEPETFFCSWCGRERQRDALSIHHCGSRERRPVFCSGCGRGLERDDDRCAACGTPSTRLSPG